MCLWWGERSGGGNSASNCLGVRMNTAPPGNGCVDTNSWHLHSEWELEETESQQVKKAVLHRVADHRLRTICT